MMAVLMALTLVVYIFIARNFRYKQVGVVFGAMSRAWGLGGRVRQGKGAAQAAPARSW